MTVRRIHLPVLVSSVSLAANISAYGETAGEDASSLAFGGRFGIPAEDWRSGVSDIDGVLAGLAVRVKCLSAHPARDSSGKPGMGWLQFCPITREMGAAVEARCCPRRFASLKNAIHFGHGRPGARLTLDLEIEAGEAAIAGAPVRRFPLVGLSLDVNLQFDLAGDASAMDRVPSGERTVPALDSAF